MDTPSIKLKLKAPRFPNFLKLEGNGVLEMTLSIGALNDEELEQYAEYWKQGLIEHAKKKRAELNFEGKG